jgi:SHS2 domain-containing protein
LSPIRDHAADIDPGGTRLGTVETFDHTADVGLRITSTELSDLFKTAAEGVFDYIVANREQVRVEHVESVSLGAESAEDLLLGWLSELIFRSETTHQLFTEFDVQVAEDGQSLEARIGGEPIDRERHMLDHEVKAVTHHGLVLRRDGEAWFAEVILDI